MTTAGKDIYFDVVAILEFFNKGMATSDMLAAELRSIRNTLGEQLPESAREEARQRAIRMAESAAARILYSPVCCLVLFLVLTLSAGFQRVKTSQF